MGFFNVSRWFTASALESRLPSLKFQDPEQEQAFLREYRSDACVFLKWLSLVALFLLLAFIWDDQNHEGYGDLASGIRIVLGIPVCLGGWYLARRANAQDHINSVAAVFILLFSAVTASIAVAFEPGPLGITGGLGAANFQLIIVAVCTLTCLPLTNALLVASGVIAIHSLAAALWGSGEFFEFLFGYFSNDLYALVLGATACYQTERTRRGQFMAKRKLAEQNLRYQELLYTMVPEHIARRIAKNQFPIADYHGEVSVLFSDLVGFTAITASLPPRGLVTVLNDLFSAFDVAAKELNVDRIKTIGDGYMAASVSGNEVGGPLSVVLLAIRMVELTREIGEKHHLPLSIRIGVHSGDLISGVIGTSRYAYDLWGTTVNLASRLESSGVPGKIQLSEQTYNKVRGTVKAVERGHIDVKGFGSLRTYII